MIGVLIAVLFAALVYAIAARLILLRLPLALRAFRGLLRTCALLAGRLLETTLGRRLDHAPTAGQA